MGIEQYLQQILSARYGKDVRQSIHDSIYEINEVSKKAEYDASTAQESAKAYAQAALASEQAAEDYKTAAEQAAEQAMSGTPEGYADLVAKVNSIYRQTATSYNVVGTSEGSALAHTIYGMSVQDGTPTPSVPVEIKSAKADFRCTGKNLIPYPYSDGTSKTSNGITFTVNSDGSVTANGTATGESIFTLRQGGASLNSTNNIKVHPDKNLVLSGCPSGGSPNNYMIQVSLTNGTNIWANVWGDRGEGKSFSFIPSVGYYNIAIIRIVIASGVTANNLTFRPMLTLADADQTYEPYQHTDVTTDLTLRAIEVTSSDDYNLERDGKYYVADTVDWFEDRGYEITRRVKQAVVDGSNVKATYYQQITLNGVDVKQINLTDTANDVIKKIGAYVLSNILESVIFSARKVNSILVANNDGIIASYYDTDMPFSSITTFNTWAQNNPFIINYILATPTTEPITSEQAQALLGLKTYDEATSISATGNIEPSLDLEYSKDRNTALALTGHNLAHKNALKLNDINTALIELGGN